VGKVILAILKLMRYSMGSSTQDGNKDKDMQVLYTCAETATNRQAGLVTQRPEHRPHQPCVCHRCTPAPTPMRGTESQHHYQSCY